MKSVYMDKDLGGGATLRLKIAKHPAMELKLPVLEFSFSGKTLMCFLADEEGTPCVLELFEALGEYIGDVEDVQLNNMEIAEKAFVSKLISAGKMSNKELNV